MKQTFKLWMLLLSLMLGFAACDNNDNAVSPDSQQQSLKGLWWAMYQSEGVVNGDANAYTRMAQALQFNDDGTGWAATFYFNDEGDSPIGMKGGHGFAPFTYTIGSDGRVRLAFPHAYQPDADYYSAFTIMLDDWGINMASAAEACHLEPANVSEEQQVKDWDAMINGGNGNPPYNELRSNIENDGQPFSFYKDFELNNQIDKYNPSGTWDWLKASGKITVEFRVIPLYMQSSNGSKAGDYYFVTATVIPHNNSLWQPYSEDHFWAQIRIYGYWMKELDFSAELVNSDGSAVKGLQYYSRPIPENKNDSRNYTNGKTVSIGGTLSAGYSEKQGFNGGVSLSCGATWSSTTSYTLETVEYTLDTSTPTVKYHYFTQNVKLSDDMDNMDKNFPPACRSEFSGHSYWVWFVPSDDSAVKDGSTSQFRLKAKVNAKYSSWYHWRWAIEYDGNRKDYDVSLDNGEGFLLPNPDRTPWGIVALKNASSFEMAHVRFYKSGQELGDAVAELSSSFSKDQVAKQGLVEGSYTVVYDFMDPDTNQVLSTWKLENVKVSQGRDEAAATTEVSTVNATPVE